MMSEDDEVSFYDNFDNKIRNSQKFNFKNLKPKYFSKSKNIKNSDKPLSVNKQTLNNISCPNINYIQKKSKKHSSNMNSASSININININNSVYEINGITNFIKEKKNNDNEIEKYKQIEHENYYDSENDSEDKNICISHAIPYDSKRKSNSMNLVEFLTKHKKDIYTLKNKFVKQNIISRNNILNQNKEEYLIINDTFDKDLLKLNLNERIYMANAKIKMLQSSVQSRNIKLLCMQLDFEKRHTKDKLKKNFHNLSNIIFKYKNQIRNLETIKDKCDRSFIKKEVLVNELNNEDLAYRIQKLNYINKILEYKLIIKNMINENNEEYSSLNSSRLLIDEMITSKNVNISKIQIFEPIISINSIKNKYNFNENYKNKKTEKNRSSNFRKNC